MSHQDVFWLQVPVHHILGMYRLEDVYDLRRVNPGCLLMQATQKDIKNLNTIQLDQAAQSAVRAMLENEVQVLLVLY